MAKDIALAQFLGLLQWMWQVLLQDAALLYARSPLCGIFRYPLFNSPLFQLFAAASSSVIANAEEQSQLTLHNLPANLVSSIHGLLTGIAMEREQEREANLAQWCNLWDQLGALQGVVETLAGARGTRRKGQISEWLLPMVFPDPPLMN